MASATAAAGTCRFYAKEIPDIGDLVMVRVKSVTDTAAYADLLEYNGMEGMLPFTELTRKGYVRSVAKFVKVGRLEVAQVLRVDKEKGYIDLSKKQVNARDRAQCEENYAKAKLVHSVMMHGAVEAKMKLEEVMRSVAWPLYAKSGHAFDALKLAVNDPDAVFGEFPSIPAALRESLQRTVVHRLKAKPSKLRADLDVTCFSASGIDAIKRVLMLGKAAGEQGDVPLPIDVTIVAPPSYIMRAQTELKDEGLRKLREVIELMQKEMALEGGKVEIVVPPRVVGDDGEDVKLGEDGEGSDESSDNDA